MKKIHIPSGKKQLEKLRVADEVALSGIIYTARDQAHRRLIEALQSGRSLPINLRGAFIYYCGPAKAREKMVIGSCGPTTSMRMDKFTPELLRAGIEAMIGKGRRSPEVIKAIKRYKAVYFLTYAGCGALLSRYIKKAKPIAYKDLGPEAIYELKVQDFPLIVGVDSKGNSIYRP